MAGRDGGSLWIFFGRRHDRYLGGTDPHRGCIHLNSAGALDVLAAAGAADGTQEAVDRRGTLCFGLSGAVAGDQRGIIVRSSGLDHDSVKSTGSCTAVAGIASRA